MKGRLRYVIDSRYYNGTCLTCMTDGVRSDHGGETLEELRTQENNPYLTVVTSKRIDKMNRLYLQSLCAPFKEITEGEYYDLLHVGRPLRMKQDSFFAGDYNYNSVYIFCFTRESRYFIGMRPAYTPQIQLDNEIDMYMTIINRKAVISKEETSKTVTTGTRLIPYYFSLDGKQPVFICNLVIQSNSRQARTDMANTLKSLRRNHYQFYKGKGHYETPDELIDHVSGKKLTLVSDGHFFQYPPGRESATFIGHIKETSEEFLFRIYDREYFLYLLKRLRTVKKESAQEQINIKS